MTNERPIVCSGSEVRAILDGRKTQTRRVLSPQPRKNRYPTWIPPSSIDSGHFVTLSYYATCAESLTCPYGQPGDRLWVREAWSPGFAADDEVGGDPGRTIYATTVRGPEPERWRSPIFMPRTRSRITLDVVSVRVERLQEISDGDVAREGVDWNAIGGPLTSRTRSFAADAFSRGWDSINAKRGYSWESNPWAWVLTFSRVGDASTVACTKLEGVAKP